MVRLLEKLGKECFQRHGLDCPDGEVVTSPDDADRAARAINDTVVIKAHVPVGKRGVAGGVRFADTPEEAREIASDLLGTELHNYPVDSLIVEQSIPIEQEMYASVTFSSSNRSASLIFSSQGGMDIEEIAEKYPDSIVQRELDPTTGLEAFEARQVAVESGVSKEAITSISTSLVRLVDAFLSLEASLVEVNPLAVCQNTRVVAADAVVKLDEHAEDRHSELFKHQYAITGDSWRPPTTLENDLHEADGTIGDRRVLRFLELDGDIGNCITGGGGSLTAMDTFKRYGGEPANYLDATPTQDPRKYELATIAALKSGVKGLIFGGNILSLAKTDIKARGLVDGLKRAEVDPEEFPVIARLAGPNQDRAEEILSELPGIESLGDSVSIEEAIKQVIERTENVDSTAHVDVDLMDIQETQSMEVDQ